jgi:hypothetical protein
MVHSHTVLQTASKYELHSNHLCSLEEWARSELHANHLCSLQEWARSIYIKNHTGHYTFRAMHTRPHHTTQGGKQIRTELEPGTFLLPLYHMKQV